LLNTYPIPVFLEESYFNIIIGFYFNNSLFILT